MKPTFRHRRPEKRMQPDLKKCNREFARKKKQTGKNSSF
jgi:hypothetical protein